ncbi:MAG: Ig-like domain-containing protein [Thermoleophilia bacterium]|nr:Ig-like domain-containing protein [Thermoleophilia bacterium]
MTGRMRFLSALSLVLISLLLLGSGVSAAGGDDSRGRMPLEQARQVLEERLLGTVGFAGIAHSEKEGSIIVFAENEWSKARMPAWFEGYPVRVEVSGRFHAVPTLVAEPEAPFFPYAAGQSRLAAVRPLVGGTSFSACVPGQYWAGTLGLVTYNNKLLSNAHVIALDLSNNWLPIGTPVVQPATLEGGTLADDRVGALEDYIPINFKRAANHADAAIASVDAGVAASPGWQFGETGDYQISGTTTVVAGDSVRKSGRTTGVTESTVYLTNASVTVDYGLGRKGYFVDQIIVHEPFIEAGDSGSAVDKDGRFVGLVFAGSDSLAIVCKASYIIEGLGIEVEPQVPATLESIAVTPDSASIAVGGTQQFTATAMYSGGATVNVTSTASWSSSSEAVASVVSGLATGLGVGSATITAAFEALSDTASLTVTEELPSLVVTVTTEKASYKTGDTVVITVSVTDASVNSVAGATVAVQVKNAKGVVRFSGDALTDESGVATFSYTIVRRDGTGTFQVSASAEKSGYEPGFGSASFAVSK